MRKLSFLLLFALTVFVLYSAYYVKSTTDRKITQKEKIVTALLSVKENYQTFLLDLSQGSADVQQLQRMQTKLREMPKEAFGYEQLQQELAAVAKAYEESPQKAVDAAGKAHVKTVVDTLVSNLNRQSHMHRQNLFAYLKFLVGLFLLFAGVVAYYIYFNDREKDKLRRIQNTLQKNLVTDDLTKIGNRAALYRQMAEHEKLTLVLFNISKFKRINDFYGLKAGDFVLQSFASLLKQRTIECRGARLYRVGGDDFAVVIEGNNTARASTMAVAALEYFENRGIVYGDNVIDLNLYVGISSLVPYLETADLALKEAKKDPNTSVVVYTPNLDKSQLVQKNINALKLLKEGIEHNGFFPHFQPIVDLRDNSITKYEALVRLHRSDGSIIYPASFIGAAKEAKLLNKLTKIMLIKSFEIFKHTDSAFSINLSFSEIKDPGNQEEIIKIIDGYGRHAKKLTLEILEDDEVDDYALLHRFLAKVQTFGVSIAIDDFGSGYSNFGHVISMNTNWLKIDGSLIKIVDYDVQARVLVKSIVDFAKSMQIKTVAEFVHSKDVYDTVKRLGIDYAQGYYLAKPAKDLIEKIDI
ncbi:MAG: EAL domain-containing protein [Campylobacterota bacterium]